MKDLDIGKSSSFDAIETQAEAIVSLLKALSNEKRLVIICALSEGEKNVGELEKRVDLSQSALSQHLARLRRDGIVKTRREAQTIYYSLQSDQTKKVMDCLSELATDDFI